MQNRENDAMENENRELEKSDAGTGDKDIKEINALLGEQDWMKDLTPNDNANQIKRNRNAGKVTSKRKKSKKKKRNTPLRIMIGILIVILVLVMIVVASFFVMRKMGMYSLLKHTSIEDVSITAPETAELDEDGQIVYYNGQKYHKNNDLISILCMGIDKEKLNIEGEVVGQGGQADSLFLILMDTISGKTTLLNMSRDSMTDVERYNDKGKYIDTKKLQLCLAYAYGDGKETSCQNTMKAVSRLLYGMPIDAYAAIDLPAITVLNDAVGGVEVDVLEDLSKLDPAMTEGAHITLKGNQAENYVRSREFGEDAPIDANNARMARQRQYVLNFINKVVAGVKADVTLPVTLYDVASSYMVTDIDVSRVTYLASLFTKVNFSENDIVTVPGTVKKGEKYAEYYVDDEALYEIILDLFYVKEQ